MLPTKIIIFEALERFRHEPDPQHLKNQVESMPKQLQEVLKAKGGHIHYWNAFCLRLGKFVCSFYEVPTLFCQRFFGSDYEFYFLSEKLFLSPVKLDGNLKRT